MSHKHLLWGAVNIPALTLPIQISYRTTDFDGVADAFKLIVRSSTGARVGGDAVFLQMGGYVRKGDRVRFVRGLPEVFEQNERAVCE